MPRGSARDCWPSMSALPIDMRVSLTERQPLQWRSGPGAVAWDSAAPKIRQDSGIDSKQRWHGLAMRS
jgi:hypothetical protein